MDRGPLQETRAVSGHVARPRGGPSRARSSRSCSVVSRRAMSRIYRSLPPQGTRLGIAFSGGLDTRCAVAWLSRQGMNVCAYTADLAQPAEEDPAAIPPVAT